MFDNKKLKNIMNKINSSPSLQKRVKTNNKTVELLPVKITGSEKVGNVYHYSWEGVKKNGNFDNCIGKSGTDTKAIASCEIGKTISQPTYQNGDVVMLRRSGSGIVIVSGGGGGQGSLDPILDLTQTDNTEDITGWEDGFETTNDIITGESTTAVKFKTLVRTEYSATDDLNYEYYRVLEFDDKGILRKVNMVVKVNGFETTLHT